jgi:hypothetical protein
MTRRFVITALAAVTLAAPALAQTQLERSLGVQPGLYTTAELVRMRTAAQENDTLTYRTIERRGLERRGEQFLSAQGASRDHTPSASISEGPLTSRPHAGKEQLAASLGVDADDHTLAQLSAMFIDAHN